MNRSIGGFVLYIATALFLLANGVMGFFGGSNGGIFNAMVSGIFGGGGISTILAVIFAILAIVAGAALLLELFGIEFSFIEIILIAFCVLWILVILVSDIINPLRHSVAFWSWLSALASHLIVLGALISASRTLGGSN